MSNEITNRKFISRRAKAAREYSTNEEVRIHYRDGFTDGYEEGLADGQVKGLHTRVDLRDAKRKGK